MQRENSPTTRVKKISINFTFSWIVKIAQHLQIDKIYHQKEQKIYYLVVYIINLGRESPGKAILGWKSTGLVSISWTILSGYCSDSVRSWCYVIISKSYTVLLPVTNYCLLFSLLFIFKKIAPESAETCIQLFFDFLEYFVLFSPRYACGCALLRFFLVALF